MTTVHFGASKSRVLQVPTRDVALNIFLFQDLIFKKWTNKCGSKEDLSDRLTIPGVHSLALLLRRFAAKVLLLLPRRVDRPHLGSETKMWDTHVRNWGLTPNMRYTRPYLVSDVKRWCIRPSCLSHLISPGLCLSHLSIFQSIFLYLISLALSFFLNLSISRSHSLSNFSRFLAFKAKI